MNNQESKNTHPLDGGKMPAKLSSQELWNWQAGSFNFELNQEELLKKALEKGFVTKIDGEDDLYQVNGNY